MAGISVGTMALIIVLSVFNGFEGLVISLFNTFNPDLVIEAREGKTFDISSFPSEQIKRIEGVDYFIEVIEENVLLQNGDKQHIGNIKGVGADYPLMSGIDSSMLTGDFILSAQGINYAVVGSGVAYFLDVRIGLHPSPITIFAPKKTQGYNLNIDQDFNSFNILPSGVFSVEQTFDSKYVIAPIEFVRKLVDYDKERTAVEIGIASDANVENIQKEIKTILGSNFKVKNRFEQQELLYKIMKSEKWAIFLILSFILLIATFNVIGSLSMLILDKKKDIAVLQSMGANNQLIRKIFLMEGSMITLIGAFLGLLLGSLICVLQMQFGFIGLGQGEGAFVVDAYPVVMQVPDFIYIFMTVCTIGILASWIPARQISKKYLEVKLS